MSKPSKKKRAKQLARQRRLRRLKGFMKPPPIRSQTLRKIDKTWEAACDKAEAEGFPKETVFAMRKTGTMLSEEAIEKGEAKPEEIIAWHAAIKEYRAKHPEEQIVDDKGKRIGDGQG